MSAGALKFEVNMLGQVSSRTICPMTDSTTSVFMLDLGAAPANTDCGDDLGFADKESRAAQINVCVCVKRNEELRGLFAGVRIAQMHLDIQVSISTRRQLRHLA